MDPLAALRQRIGDTPLYEIRRIPIPNGNRIFAKEEWRNPSGSHYDRIYHTLFSALEAEGKISRGRTRLIETSSGCAGASFAWFCKELGYSATVVVPADLPPSRIEAIKRHGATIVSSPAGKYMAGAVVTLRELLDCDKHQAAMPDQRLYCLDHSRNFRSVTAMYAVAREVKRQLRGTPVDFFVGACGNGASLIGIGDEFKRISPGIRVVACDPAEAPVAFVRRYPGKYEPPYGHDPCPRQHNVFGTGAWGIRFPFLEEPLFSEVIDEAYIVEAHEWQKALSLLHTKEQQLVGRSTALTLAVAIKISERVSNCTFVIPFYDSFETYS